MQLRRLAHYRVTGFLDCLTLLGLESLELAIKGGITPGEIVPFGGKLPLHGRNFLFFRHQVGQQRLQFLAAPREHTPGVLDNLGRNAQPGGGGHGVAAAGDTHRQAVGRRQRGGVELERGVFQSGSSVGECLEVAVMRGGDGQRPPGEEIT